MIGLGGGVGGCKAVERWHPLHDAKRIDFKSCELHWQPQPLAPGPPTFPRPTGRAGNVSPNPAALSRAAPCGTLDLLPARARRVVLEDNDRGKNLKKSGSRGKDASAKRKDLKITNGAFADNDFMASPFYCLAWLSSGVNKSLREYASALQSFLNVYNMLDRKSGLKFP